MLATYRAPLHTLILLVATLFVAACASTPPVDTLNKKLAAFEVSYEEVLDRAATLKGEDRLSEATVEDLTRVFDRIDQVRSAAYSALENGDQEKAEDRLERARELLSAARDIFRKLEGG